MCRDICIYKRLLGPEHDLTSETSRTIANESPPTAGHPGSLVFTQTCIYIYKYTHIHTPIHTGLQPANGEEGYKGHLTCDDNDIPTLAKLYIYTFCFDMTSQRLR